MYLVSIQSPNSNRDFGTYDLELALAEFNSAPEPKVMHIRQIEILIGHENKQN